MSEKKLLSVTGDQVETLSRMLANDRTIERTLVRNGYSFQSRKDQLAQELLIDLEAANNEKLDRFYGLFSKENNRSVIKRLCVADKPLSKGDLKTCLDSDHIETLLNELETLGAIEEYGQGNYELSNKQADIGTNLEWLMAEIFRRELFCTSDWGVHIKEAPDGGDYDVVARAENNLIYVECKAKPPENIKKREIIQFLKRDEFLRAYLGIFFIDTTSSIEGIVKTFNNIGARINQLCLNELDGGNYGPGPYTEALDKNVHHFQHRLFFINSARPILKSVKMCLRHRHRTGDLEQAYKGRFWLQEEIVNRRFKTGE